MDNFVFQFETYGTLVVASLVLLLGRKLIVWFPTLNTYTIPYTVVGGIAAAVLLLVLKIVLNIDIRFNDSAIKEPLLLAFFATVGLNADLLKLRAGGRLLAIFFVAVAMMVVIQNLVGVGIAKLLGLDPLFGLLAGSVTMIGGHGTGLAWGATFVEKYNIHNANEVAAVCATLGLVFGGLVGGPTTKFLMKKTAAAADANTADDEVEVVFEKPSKARSISAKVMIESIALIVICLSLGKQLEEFLKGTTMELPTFVCVLFIGLILGNLTSLTRVYKIQERTMSVLGSVSLSLFIAMALMALQFSQISSLAFPIMVLIFAQVVVMVMYAIWVTYRLMGKNYDAVVIAAGHCGFGLGATPTAVANMQAVTDKYGPSHIAFILVPITGAFLVDITNSAIIKLFIAGLTT